MPKTLGNSKYNAKIKDEKKEPAAKTDIAVKDDPEKLVEKIYFSKSARHTLSGLVPEVRYQDGRMRGEQVVQFSDHFVHTSDPKVQAHIEKSEPFKAKFIKIVSRAKYEVLTEQLIRAKRTGETVRA